MTPNQQDTLDRATAVIEFVAVAIPELERADLFTERTAFAAYSMLSSVTTDLRRIPHELA